jgi:exodeoxyribonuclease VII small subunit
MAEKKITFNKAMQELEEILENLEAGELDVDELSSRVKRASVLIKLCKSRLKSTDEEIEKILREME